MIGYMIFTLFIIWNTTYLGIKSYLRDCRDGYETHPPFVYTIASSIVTLMMFLAWTGVFWIFSALAKQEMYFLPVLIATWLTTLLYFPERND